MLRKKNTTMYFSGLVVLLLVVWSSFPIIWNILTSIKNRADIFSLEPKIFFTPDWSSFKTAFTPGSSSIYNYLNNSLKIAIGATSITLVIGIMAAYPLSRKNFKFKSSIWIMILATRLLPPISTIVPLFLLASKFKMVDTYFFL